MLACMEAYRFPVLSLLAQLVAQSGPRSVGKRLPVLCKCFHRLIFLKVTRLCTLAFPMSCSWGRGPHDETFSGSGVFFSL